MVSLRHGGHQARRRWLLKRSPLAVLPLALFGSLAVAASPAGASTSAPSVTQAASSGGVPDLGPTIAAVEAEVSSVLATVTNVPLPLLGSVGCVPYYVSSLISGERPYPCA
jgi:2-methylisocitrate lyase-like PEP mutase family enzyme